METKKNKSYPSAIMFLTIAFIEGAAVMAAELLGAKMVAPFFGTTIYSWAAVLALTLLALATGYYLGGHFTSKYKPTRILTVVLIASGGFLILMPFISNMVMHLLIDSSIISGLIISLMIFMFPPVLFFGMVSPVIIHALVNDVDSTGKMAGKVYAISTIGGVISTLFLGFYVIPEFGIKIPAMIYGVVILLLPLLIYKGKKRNRLVVMLLAFMVISIAAQWKQSESSSQRMKIRYTSEGLLGQVKVVDIEGMVLDGKSLHPRGLLVNNTWQTIYNRADGENLLDYVYFIKPLLTKYDGINQNALLVGLGGGMLAREMSEHGYNLEVVEIDARLEKIARRYFDMDPETNVIIDDGRHYIEKIDKTYKLVILDAFLGENAPWHLLTKECFETIKRKLDNDGMLVIEFFGITDGELGQGARSVYKTLEDTGFEVSMITTRKGDAEDKNLVFVATEEPFSFDGLSYDSLKYFSEPIIDLNDYRFTFSDEAMVDALLLTDNLPTLEILLAKPSLMWRKNLNEILRNVLVEENYPIFY